MRALIFVFLLSASTQADMSPVGAVREVVQYAIELPDSCLCVLTAQRLALIDSADAEVVTDSVWMEQAKQRNFAIHAGHAYVPLAEGIAIIRIHADRLERLDNLKVSSRMPIRIARDTLFIQEGSALAAYSLETPSRPTHKQTIELRSAGAFAVDAEHLYVSSSDRLTVFELARFTEIRSVRIPAKATAMHLRDGFLYLAATRTLYRCDLRNFEFEKLGERVGAISSLSIARITLPLFMASRGSTSAWMAR